MSVPIDFHLYLTADAFVAPAELPLSLGLALYRDLAQIGSSRYCFCA